jgi:cell division protein FtsL
MILAAIFVNSLAILVLYTFIYRLFYQHTSLEHEMSDLKDDLKRQDNQSKNLVQDINHNNKVLRLFLNKYAL